MISWLDSLIDSITMYRLLIYYLIGLLLAAMGLSITGSMHYNAFVIAASASLFVLVCWAVNVVLSQIFKAPRSGESAIITGLILSLIITPDITSKNGILFLLAASGLAMGSKYILAIKKQHIFNPAAIAVVLTAFGAKQSASWWVGTLYMLPFVIIGGVLIARKTQRITMITSFLLATAAATIIYSTLGHTGVITNLKNLTSSSGIFFMGFVMLTEPYTSPGTRNKQVWYAALVGALFPPQVHLFRLYSTPELSLIAGNIFSYLVETKERLLPMLVNKRKLSSYCAEFIFDPGAKFDYKPGQYMEWTLPHEEPDNRGNRRYFTLASSPTEKEVRIAVRFFDPSSTFKHALLNIEQDTPIAAGRLSGDFTLPDNLNQDIVFIAGGIGITPFRSMIKYLCDKGLKAKSLTLLYGVNSADDIPYKKFLDQAQQILGLKIVYVLSKSPGNSGSFRTGYINGDLIEGEVPNYKHGLYYLAGPHSMTSSVTHELHELGVHSTHIKTDFFPGYA
jgi:ferredoxin-NADP reductase/Na+-translocating ferredoxin:NAD+ oxidoreductase RnfD subunit